VGELGVGHDLGARESARRRLLIRFLAFAFRLLFYPLLSWRRLRAAPLGGWVELEVDGSVPELSPPKTLLGRLRRKPVVTLADLRAVVTELVHDPRPQGFFVTLRDFSGGMASATALRDVLSAVRRGGKRVVVHIPHGVDTRGYFVVSAAERIFAFPEASVSLLGFASRGVYLRQMLANAGVVAEVLAHGKYKSAGESLSRDSMSEPQREQVGALLDKMYGELGAALRDGRGLTADEAKAAIDRAVYRVPEAIAAKLVDEAVFDDEVPKKLAGGDGTASRVVSASDYLRARRATKAGQSRRAPYIAVLRVHGAISQGGSPLSAGATERDVVAAARAVREDKRARGVIVHIDSPGGSALASARMHRELELLADDKPLVACMSNVAASGGYYVAAPSHAIVAEPVTITGSIGVIAARFAFAPLLARLGVHVDVEKRGIRADLHDPTRPLTDEERQALEREIDGTYNEFVAVVARGRKMSVDAVDAVAQGRVWTGEDARSRGLVDVLGGFDVALEEVKKRVGKGGDALTARVVRVKSKDTSTFAASPLHHASVALEGAMGPWAQMLPFVPLGERVFLWEPTGVLWE
jgi:protease IV